MECHIPPVCEKKSTRPSALTPGLFGRFHHRASFPWKRFLVHKVLSLERNAHRQQQSSWRLRKEKKRGQEYRILVHRRTQLQARLTANYKNHISSAGIESQPTRVRFSSDKQTKKVCFIYVLKRNPPKQIQFLPLARN